MYNIKDPVSALTHFFGALLSIPITALMVYKGIIYGSSWHIISYAIFGLSLFLLYASSTIYHTLKVSENATKVLKKIDHMMIFVLIAGTYTPVCLVSIRGVVGYSIFGLVWTIALAGIILKAFWIDAPRSVSTSIYVIMGWIIVFALYPIWKVVSFGGVTLLALGGISYTLGAVIYALKWPKINSKTFGFHEIFHLFVLAGSGFHVSFIFMYVY
jgi:hemolysin III